MIVNLMRFARVSYRGQGTIEIKTDVPGPGLATAANLSLPGSLTRRQIRLTLPQDTKGATVQVKLSPAAGQVLIPFEVQIFCKPLGSASAWTWKTIPIPTVSEEWQHISIPVPPTPEEWTRVDLPIPPTPEDWQRVSIPIPPTPEEWQRLTVVDGADTNWQWRELPAGEQ